MIVGGVTSPSTEPQSRNPREGALLSVGGQGQRPQGDVGRGLGPPGCWDQGRLPAVIWRVGVEAAGAGPCLPSTLSTLTLDPGRH